MTDINEQIKASFNNLLESKQVKSEINKENQQNILDDLMEIYSFAFLFGDSYTKGEKINFKSITSKKKEMINEIFDKYGEKIHLVAIDIYNEGYKKGNNPDVIIKRLKNKITFYDYKYEPNFRMYDWNSNPVECFKNWFSSKFSEVIEVVNNRDRIQKLGEEMGDKNGFKELVTNERWKRRFVHYCYIASLHELYLGRLYKIKGRGAIESFEGEKEYEKIINELTKELNTYDIDQKVIDFHIKFANMCAEETSKLVYEDQCFVLDMIIDKSKYDDYEKGILRFEMFISANVGGSW